MTQTAEKMDSSVEIFEPSDEIKSRAHIKAADYETLYKRSIDDPEGFWGDMAKRLDWFKAPTKIKDVSYAQDDLHIKWYEDGVLNACYNCVDRHLPARENQTALIWEGDNPEHDKKITYSELKGEVCRLANRFSSCPNFAEAVQDVGVP